MERVVVEMARAHRDGEHICLAMVDLDHFKQVNDTYGHDAGDIVLCETAARMSSVLRPYDSIGRYGGEEFLVVFPKCEVADAATIAERIRCSISCATVRTQTEEILVTASIGIAEVRHSPDTTAVIREADDALFQAKQKGRDRVELSALDRMPITAETVNTPRPHRRS